MRPFLWFVSRRELFLVERWLPPIKKPASQIARLVQAVLNWGEAQWIRSLQ